MTNALIPYEFDKKYEGVINVNVYIELAKFPVFSIEDVTNLTGNKNAAYSLMNRLMKKGLVKKIRNNVYSVVNPTSNQIIATRFQVACAITDTAYLSHYSAFEFYGIANQVFYEMYVSSETKFNHFEYDNITYKFVSSKMKDGVVKANNTSGVRITDIERTVVDSIKDLNKIGGLENLLSCLDAIHYLDEDKLKHYLAIYNVQGLFQRVGYILNHFKEEMQLSEDFIRYCKSKIGESKRYLISNPNENSYYNSDWKLMIPKGLFDFMDQGENELA